MLRVGNLDAAISFYQDKLGHRLLWRSDHAAGFALPETDAELVGRLDIGPETDILVRDVDKAYATFLRAGGEFRPAAIRYRDRAVRACAIRLGTNSSYWINQNEG